MSARFLITGGAGFIGSNLADVLLELREAGYPIEDAWFAPHFNFRFPIHGAVTQRGITLELRQALEPWHVLGEEPGGGGTVRYVGEPVAAVLASPDHALSDAGWWVAQLRGAGSQGRTVVSQAFPWLARGEAARQAGMCLRHTLKEEPGEVRRQPGKFNGDGQRTRPAVAPEQDRLLAEHEAQRLSQCLRAPPVGVSAMPIHFSDSSCLSPHLPRRSVSKPKRAMS